MTWTHDMATRRVALLRREITGAITADQRAELVALTEALRAQTRPMFVEMISRADAALAVSSLDVPGARLPACRECGAFDPCEHDRGEDA